MLSIPGPTRWALAIGLSLPALVGCGGGGGTATLSETPGTTAPAGTFRASGAAATAEGQSGTLSLTFATPVTAAASLRAAALHGPAVPLATTVPGDAQGTLALPGGTFALAGTFTPATGALALAGGGYHFAGQATFSNNLLASVSGRLTTDATSGTGPTATLAAGPVDAQAGAFTRTGDMVLARANHTLTVLRNGKVLAAGGANANGRLSGAELYDPATGTFAATGSLAVGTEEHAAVLLKDGTVLVIAGRDYYNQATARVERYNPATGTFTLQNPLNHARLQFPAATLLADGKVLVLGGAAQPGGSTDSSVPQAEIYDPDAADGPNPARLGRSVDTGSLNVPRSQPALVPNPSNPDQILVLGGFVGGEGGNSTRVPESYRISTGVFTPLMPQLDAKRGGGVFQWLQDGRWLLAGGYDMDSDRVLGTAALVDPALNNNQGGLVASGNMTTSLFLCGSVRLLDGRVLVVGGTGSIWTRAGVDSGMVFNPAANGGQGAFTTLATRMSAGRTNPSVAMLPDGRVLITGGLVQGDTSTATARADLFH